MVPKDRTSSERTLGGMQLLRELTWFQVRGSLSVLLALAIHHHQKPVVPGAAPIYLVDGRDWPDGSLWSTRLAKRRIGLLREFNVQSGNPFR